MNSTVKPENDIAGTATQRPLLSRDFVLLVAGQGISLFGNVMLRFAMSMWVLDETGSATIFASVLAISIVPTILLSPFGGDGYDMEARGGEDDGARQHEHGGDGVERHHDGAAVDAIGQHASERGEQDGRHDGDGQHRGEDGG